MKSRYVSDLRVGDKADGVYLVQSRNLSESRNGSFYIRMQLADRTGSITGFQWDVDENAASRIHAESFVEITGSVRSYQDKLQIDVGSIRSYNDTVNPEDFLRVSERDRGEMLSKVLALVDTIENPYLKSLLDYFFSNDDFRKLYSEAPGAQKIHHAWIGGLMEHCLTVAEMCELVVKNYSGIDRDLLVTSALLHDIGKIEEYSWDTSIRYSDSGHLVGHIVSGAIMLEKAMDSINGFPTLLRLIMLHMILSHHGTRDFGSPKRPKCLEAIILHEIEDMDAKIDIVKKAIAATDEDDAGHWTERHWLLERPLFKGKFTQEKDADAGDALDEYYDPFEEDYEPQLELHQDYDPFAEE